ncbi:uncharacterized protein UBRO2_05639 [Ustilago bromivora]|uniref:Uncharacterized protein n=1 Tax=Ustilago bromivora TaxID=307758 RepID=A0A8H8TUX3_9BASI|nr:uncharacterized protein UBRO2_05639 [Ustilago bromivora]
MRMSSTGFALDDLKIPSLNTSSTRSMGSVPHTTSPCTRQMFCRLVPNDRTLGPWSPLPSAWDSLQQWPLCSGTVLQPALTMVLMALSPPFTPSAPSALVPTYPAFQPLASSSSSGSAACQLSITPTTQPSMNLDISTLTMLSLASTSMVSAAAISSGPYMATNASMVYKVAITLAFACFLCSREVVWEHSSNPAFILQVASVALEPDHAVITILALKTDPFRLGVKVVAPLMGGSECPTSHLQPLLSRLASSPLFGLGPSRSALLSRSASVSTLRRVIAASGLSPSAYAGHSFCCGAATWAASLGADADTIQCFG